MPARVPARVPAWVPARAIEKIFLVKRNHMAKERFFVQNRKVLSIKIYTLSTKANTKDCFGYNTRPFCSRFIILTIYFPKNGYICENTKPLYIHFFGKTNSFT